MFNIVIVKVQEFELSFYCTLLNPYRNNNPSISSPLGGKGLG